MLYCKLLLQNSELFFFIADILASLLTLSNLALE